VRFDSFYRSYFFTLPITACLPSRMCICSAPKYYARGAEPISGRAHDYEIVDAEQTSASIQRWIAFLCTGIRPSIGTENLIPEEVNYTKITIRVTVMNKVQFLMASEPRKPL
jgi:hypothetical protein